MKISEILKAKRSISCEFFPPKSAEGIPGVLRAIDRLKAFRPDFVSVTYGAGGSTRQFTEEITTRVKSEGELEVMAHVTCVGTDQRGSPWRAGKAGRSRDTECHRPAGRPAQGRDRIRSRLRVVLATPPTLVQHIRENFSFGIAAACYPEGHTESPDLDTDISYTKLKVQNGAEFLITQLFYDNNDFFDFMDRVRQAGIDVPVSTRRASHTERRPDSEIHRIVRRQHPGGAGQAAR